MAKYSNESTQYFNTITAAQKELTDLLKEKAQLAASLEVAQKGTFTKYYILDNLFKNWNTKTLNSLLGARLTRFWTS